MKRLHIIIYFVVTFNAIGQNYARDFLFGVEVSSNVPEKVLDHIKRESQKSFHGFKLNKKASKQLNHGDTLELKDFYRNRALNLGFIYKETKQFYLISPSKDLTKSYFKDKNLDLYYIIDEKFQYFQVVALDTSSVSTIYFLSGYISKPKFIDFKSFVSFTEIVEDGYLIRRYEYEKEDYQIREKQKLWMSIQNIPFLGFFSSFPSIKFLEDSSVTSYTYFDNDDVRLYPERFDLDDSLNTLSRKMRIWSNTPNFRRFSNYSIHLNVDVLQYYSRSIETVIEKHSQLDHGAPFFHFKDTVDSDSVRNFVEQEMQGYKGWDTSHVYCWMGDSLVIGRLYYLQKVDANFYLLTYWLSCKYRCPFLFTGDEKITMAREYNFIYDRNSNTLRLVLKRKCRSVDLIKEIK